MKQKFLKKLAPFVKKVETWGMKFKSRITNGKKDIVFHRIPTLCVVGG